MNNSYALYQTLQSLGYPKELRDPYWWPNSGTFEVVAGAILTQQTKWQKVEKALENLRGENILSVEEMAKCDIKLLSSLIKPSGFYNTKAKRLQSLCRAILETYGNFAAFQKEVTRAWLLEQKGIGEETADSILCYACYRDVLVVDNYTRQLLQAFNFTFETYQETQEWMTAGIEEHIKKESATLLTIFSQYHGMVVEYCKEHTRGKYIDIGELQNGE